MKVYIDNDDVETCILRPSSVWGKEAEVDDETVARWKRVADEWQVVQNEMYEVWCVASRVKR